jgi:hypothetical protein
MVSLSCQVPTLNQLWVLNAGSTKVLLRFFFHCLPLALFIFFPQKRVMPKTHLGLWLCTFLAAMDTTRHNTPPNVSGQQQICVWASPDIFLIGHLGRHEKRNAGVLLCFLHLRDPPLIYCGANELVLWKRREPLNTGKTLNFFFRLFLKIIKEIMASESKFSLSWVK